MKDNVVVGEVLEPYAQALMSVAQGQDLVDRFKDDASALLELLGASEQLQEFLANPLVQVDAKRAVLNQVVGEDLHPMMRNFLMVLVDRRRILFLEGILRQYLELVRKLKQTVLAEVSSAVELTEPQQQAIRDKVIAMTGARAAELDIKLDPDLIGGVIIKVGSQVIDASIRGQLRRISLRLTAS